MLAAGFFLCYPVSYVSANEDLSGEPTVVQQAGKTVTGTVVDPQGEPLIGVSVSVQGTKEGGVSDAYGHYSVQTQNDRQTLVFTYIGYKTARVTANKEVINVTLEEDAQSLGEVVVVGYGTQKKVNLTGAISTVDVNKTLDDRPVADVAHSLQGAVPGLSISFPNGEVGADPILRMRAQVASLQANASSSPLILLDNVEISSLSLINPDDIGAITVLKDASAASIYGAKAALGVILITTKKGSKTDKTSVTYSNNFSWAKVAKNIDMATIDGLEYTLAAMERIGTARVGAFWSFDKVSYERSKEWYQKYGGSIGPDDPFVYGRDWYVDGSTKMGVRMFNPYDYMVEEWTPTQTHNFSVNGVSGKTTYNVGLGYFDQSGMMKTAKEDDFKRYNASLRLSTELSKMFTLRTGFLYSRNVKSYPYMTNSTTADPWLYLYRWGPLQPFGYDENGNQMRSPAGEAAIANTASRTIDYMNLNLGSTVKFTKDWSLEFDYTFTNRQFLWNRPGTRYTLADTWSAAVPRNDTNGNRIYVDQDGKVVDASTQGAMPAFMLPFSTYTGKGANPDHIYRESENMQSHTYNAYTTYNWKLQDVHDFKFMLGTNIVGARTSSHWSQKTELLYLNNPQFDLATGTQTDGGKSYWESQAGFFGRVNYVFNQKYLAEANLRYDGSSKFPTDLKWRWFPSFSAGWIVTEEKFTQPIHDVLSFMKIRGSWGVIGDQTVPNTLYVPTLTYTTSTWLDGTTKFPYFGTPVAVDPYITWQDFETLDFGVDARFFKNELGVTFDWFQRYTRNMIIAGVTLPYTAGVPAPQGNYGELRTRGFELAVDYNHRFKNGLGVNFMATLSDGSTYITDYTDGSMRGTASTAYYKGKKLGDIYGYQVERLYQKDDFEYDANGKLIPVDVPLNPNDPNSTKTSVYKLKGDNPVYQPFVQTPATFKYGPGDVKFKDQNGDGRINNGSNTVDDPGDLVVIGNTAPRYEYGFRAGADYKGFDIQVFFQGVGKRALWGDGSLAVPGYNVSDGAMPQTFASDFWREDRTDAYYPRPFNIGAVAGGSTVTGNTQVSDRYLLNMSYLRLKNLTVGYSLPSALIQKVYLSKARVYISAENLFVFDHLRGLPIDPEARNGWSMWDQSNYNSSRTGVGAPLYKNVSFGLQLTF
ncbi:SusC/RagA family TonB-linked outer membrane protein [Bacteroidia bacterium]|nr:SusC/RagA family TonB-linked outer membrane protein [Bacteroidia bacterium]